MKLPIRNPITHPIVHAHTHSPAIFKVVGPAPARPLLETTEYGRASIHTSIASQRPGVCPVRKRYRKYHKIYTPEEDMAKRKTIGEVGEERVTRRSTRAKTATEEEEPVREERRVEATKVTEATKAKAKASPTKDEETEGDKKEGKINDTLPAKTNGTAEAEGEVAKEAPQDRQYWLMKAEPESRLEKGHDVKFSIDDLASKTEPEPWDGIRSYAARNNLRAMKKGDLAFFYHSSCKIPAIVGVMEIVQEHSPDLTAQDPKAAYYDPKDKDPLNPRWSVVHVVFKEKFATPVTLRTLKNIQVREELRDLQLLKQSRLSVSKVTSGEWAFLNRIVVEGGEEVDL